MDRLLVLPSASIGSPTRSGDSRKIPKQRRYQADMVLLRAADHPIQTLEKSLSVGKIAPLFDWPIATADKPHKRDIRLPECRQVGE